MDNPLLVPFHTPHETYPFDKISVRDIEEAILAGIERENEEIRQITEMDEMPTFENTILAMEQSGSLLERATTLMYNLLSANTSDELEELSERLASQLSSHNTDILLNKELFRRIKHVKDTVSGLNAEERMLLEKVYENFEHSGATLAEEAREKFREIRQELAELGLKFSSNLLRETNEYFLHLTQEEDLAGLPALQVQQAQHAAAERDLQGWVFTLHAPSYVPFMEYADNRALRKQMYLAYQCRCSHGGSNDNRDIVEKLVNLRLALANVLGYPDYAEYVLQHRMAKNEEIVLSFLEALLEKYLPHARREVAEIEKFARAIEGPDFTLEAWDFAYYAQKLKQAHYDFDPEALRPYFELSRVTEGVLHLAQQLYGIRFRESHDIPVYHPDVTAYEVFDADGSFLAVLYTDFFPRKSKKGGAWMTNYREQDEARRPHVSIVMNFTKPTPDKPSLLTLDEVETFLHEFGHALHGMLARTRFASLSGTNVYWDFVELPSQFMENYSTEKEFLLSFARHYQSGEPLPDELIRRIRESKNFNAAYACIRQLSFGFLDMAFYTRRQALHTDLPAFEREVWQRMQLLPEVPEACMSTHFSHIMNGGYAAGYYSYKWAEVLDADAFSVFREEGIFNPATADRFRRCILEKGGTRRPEELYEAFRRQKPTMEALLRRDGLAHPTKNVVK